MEENSEGPIPYGSVQNCNIKTVQKEQITNRARMFLRGGKRQSELPLWDELLMLETSSVGQDFCCHIIQRLNLC